MANAKTGLATRANAVAPASEQQKLSVGSLLSQDSVKKRFDDVLGAKAPKFISSLLSVVNNNKLLAKADPKTVLSAAATAASLDLPIDQNLGFAYIIPYGNQAQFQMGYKGYIQLAMRTGQYKTINACEVYEGELTKVNRFTGEYEFGERTGDNVIGYIAYFKLVNGFEKYLYMSIEDMQAHAKKFSKNYKGGTEKWGITDFHSMAIKTVLKRLISKYGIMSIEMQTMAQAISFDGGVIEEDKEGNLQANFDGETIDADGTIIDVSTGEIIEPSTNPNELTEEEKQAILDVEKEDNTNVGDTHE